MTQTLMCFQHPSHIPCQPRLHYFDGEVELAAEMVTNTVLLIATLAAQPFSFQNGLTNDERAQFTRRSTELAKLLTGRTVPTTSWQLKELVGVRSANGLPPYSGVSATAGRWRVGFDRDGFVRSLRSERVIERTKEGPSGKPLALSDEAWYSKGEAAGKKLWPTIYMTRLRVLRTPEDGGGGNWSTWSSTVSVRFTVSQKDGLYRKISIVFDDANAEVLSASISSPSPNKPKY